MAALVGINVDRTISITFVIAAALAAVAGTMYLVYYGVVSFADGFTPGVKAFTAAVLGGIGSLPGAVIGGLADRPDRDALVGLFLDRLQGRRRLLDPGRRDDLPAAGPPRPPGSREGLRWRRGDANAASARTSCARSAPPRFTGLIAFGLFLPLIAFQAAHDIRNELVLETRWPLFAVFVAIAFVGRLIWELLPRERIKPSLERSSGRRGSFGRGRRLRSAMTICASSPGPASAPKPSFALLSRHLLRRHDRAGHRRRRCRGQHALSGNDRQRPPAPQPDRHRAAHGRARLPPGLSADDVLDARVAGRDQVDRQFRHPDPDLRDARLGPEYRGRARRPARPRLCRLLRGRRLFLRAARPRPSACRSGCCCRSPACSPPSGASCSASRCCGCAATISRS